MENPKFVQIDPKWKPKGAKVTTMLPWATIIDLLRENGKIKENEKVGALYLYDQGMLLDLRPK